MSADEDVPLPTRHRARPASRRRRRIRVWLAAAGLGLAAVGVAVWLLAFRVDEGGKDKATDAINAGLALQAQGDLHGAYDKYSAALDADKNNKFAIYDLAVIDNLQDNDGLAVERYQKVLSSDPEFEPALYNLAVIYQEQGKDRFALSLYQRAVQVNPGDANAHFNLSLMLRAMGYRAEGDAQMRIARQLKPELKDPGLPTSSASAKPHPSGAASPTK